MSKQQVRALIQAQKWEEARALCKKLCKQARDDAEAWFLFGAVSGQLADWREAESCCRRVLDLRVDNPVVRFNYGIALQRQGKLDAAIEQYRAALAQKADFAEVHNELGTALQGKRQLPGAIEHYEKAVAYKPGYADAHYNLATALRESGRAAEALTHCQEALRVRPDLALAQVTLGLLMLDRGDLAEAQTAFETATAVPGGCAEAHAELATLYATQDRFDDAIVHYRRALAIKPGDAILWNRLAGTLLARMASQEDIEEAEKCYREGLRLAPGIPEIHMNYAVLLHNDGRHEEALRCYERALKLRPGDAQILGSMANVEEHLGRFDAGYARIRPLIEAGSDDGSVAVAFGALARHVDKREEAVALLERAAQKPRPGHELRSIFFKLGKLYDELKQYDAAFDRYERAHALGKVRFEPQDNVRQFDGLISAFGADNLARLPRARNASALPVFIVGMPRSGTTLVEQILASHPQVHGAGELPDIHRILHTLPATLGSPLPYPQCVESVTVEQLDKIAHRHLARLSALGRDAARVTDKMPHNFLALGLIDLLFPGARIIHCRRDPIDTCLSIYLLQFSASHPYAENLAHLGGYYRQYLRLMDHWRRVVRVPILDVRYEELVAEPERVSREVVAHCGLDWDERCLRFHESKRVVSTFSYDQVRQPIYKKSVARWKNYEKHLGSLIAALGDAVEKPRGVGPDSPI